MSKFDQQIGNSGLESSFGFKNHATKNVLGGKGRGKIHDNISQHEKYLCEKWKRAIVYIDYPN